MQYVFFIYDPVTKGVALMLTPTGAQFLIERRIINPGDPTFTIPAEDLSEEHKHWIDLVQLLEFKSTAAPVTLGVHRDKAVAFFIGQIRARRNELLDILDNLQMRAFLLGKMDVMQRMEQDKKILRDIVSTKLFDGCTDLVDFIRIKPAPVMIDYYAKYENDLIISSTT